MYVILKHIHALIAVTSVSFFCFRFLLKVIENKYTNLINIKFKKIIKILPHIIDTFLLIFGISLAIIIQQYPLVDTWITQKIIFVISYILFGVLAFRSKNKIIRFIAFFCALISVGFVVYCVKSKMSILEIPLYFQMLYEVYFSD